MRLGAQVIDLAAHYAVWVAAAFISILVVTATGNDSALSTLKNGGYVYGTASLGFILYHAVAEGLNGATLGKRLLGLVVVRENGEACTLPSALGRTLAFYIDGLFFGLVALSSMDPPYQQRFGDKWAHTYVVRRSSLPKERQESRVHFTDALALALLLDAGCYVGSVLVRIY